MKKLSLTFAILATMLACSACGGDKLEEKGVVLTPDKSSVVIEKGEKVTFTVTYNDKDVTAEAKIRNLVDSDNTNYLEGNTFSPENAGFYEFVADYNGLTSKPARIEAVSQSVETSGFYRRVCVLYFTGMWCPQCPKMHEVLEIVKEEYPERITAIAVHGGNGGPDFYKIEESTQLNTLYGIQAYPSAIVDGRGDDTGKPLSANNILIGNRVKNSIEKYPAVSGIKIDTSLAEKTLTVDTEITIDAANSYRVLAFVLEDGILGSQAGHDGQYTFNETLRGFMTDPLGDDLGQCDAGEKIKKSFSFDMTDFKSANSRVAVAVLNAENGTSIYRFNNTAECKVGESVDYRYENID